MRRKAGCGTGQSVFRISVRIFPANALPASNAEQSATKAGRAGAARAKRHRESSKDCCALKGWEIRDACAMMVEDTPESEPGRQATEPASSTERRYKLFTSSFTATCVTSPPSKPWEPAHQSCFTPLCTMTKRASGGTGTRSTSSERQSKNTAWSRVANSEVTWSSNPQRTPANLCSASCQICAKSMSSKFVAHALCKARAVAHSKAALLLPRPHRHRAADFKFQPLGLRPAR